VGVRVGIGVERSSLGSKLTTRRQSGSLQNVTWRPSLSSNQANCIQIAPIKPWNPWVNAYLPVG
jgi:hypothetical protein